MNQFKPLVVLAVLGGVLYWVYSHINSGPVTLPPGVATGWEKGPQVEGPNEAESAAIGPWNPPPAAAPAAADPATAAPGANVPAAMLPIGTAPPAPATTANPAAPLSTAAQPTATATADALATGPATASVPSDRAAAPALAANVAASTAANAIPPGPAAPPVAAPAAKSSFAVVREAVEQDLAQEKYVESLMQLSRWYDEPQLTAAESQQLNTLLDQLAGTVIYSTQHWLKPAYEVQAGDTLDSIARQHDVSPHLLAKINGIEDPSSLTPGEKLKVLAGPFSAVVNLSRQELTLMVGGMYAGRFAVGLGTDNPPVEGTYEVTARVADPVYRGPDRSVESGDEANPLGRRLLALGDRVSLHGTNEPRYQGRKDLRGSISLSQRDIEDVYDILPEGSKVTIRR